MDWAPRGGTRSQSCLGLFNSARCCDEARCRPTGGVNADGGLRIVGQWSPGSVPSLQFGLSELTSGPESVLLSFPRKPKSVRVGDLP
ncbi:unnamed protein product [Protopolystoma xenopodis]|uniref:Uncharacterized protein n=1 Tax=Protopolystoma xenopodis TaxID=117903 RepID=A0A3S5AYT2_9PLAT|nr:unnamed protein product [Protopolystoma xenopodis]